MFGKLARYARLHKIVSTIIVLAIAGGGYYWYRVAHAAPPITKYVVQAAATGSLVAAVSGTGQVQAGTTINVTPQVNEAVTSIPVSVGQHVAQGQILLQLDPTTEQQAVKADQLAVENAQLSLEELQQITTSTLIADQNAVREGTANIATASTTVASDYTNGFQGLGTVYANLQTVMMGLQNFVQGNDLSRIQNDPDAYVALMPSYLQAAVLPYDNEVQSSYQAAAKAYQQALADYHAASPTSNSAALDALFAETYNTANTVSAAVKASSNFINYIVNTYPSSLNSTKPLPAITTTLQNNFITYTNTVTSAVSSAENTITGIANDKNAYVNDVASLAQASATLNEVVAGPTPTQLLAAQIAVQTAQNNLATAEQNLADTSVRAPIAGTVSAINVTVGEMPGSGAVTMVGDGQVAEVTLNEINAAKVQVGDKATLTFDAIPNLSLAGTVVEVDPVGTVSQGVVSFNVQIGFSQPTGTPVAQSVKPGMSVSATIVTNVVDNAIVVPNAAIQTSGNTSYVREPAASLSAADLAASRAGGIALPQGTKEVPVTVGIANTTMTQILSGIAAGDQIITQTLQSSAGASTAGAASGGNALRLLGGAGGGGRGFVRSGAGG
jgi:multidrug efflux pump subunit AcrA (membrane-fusion protein)